MSTLSEITELGFAIGLGKAVNRALTAKNQELEGTPILFVVPAKRGIEDSYFTIHINESVVTLYIGIDELQHHDKLRIFQESALLDIMEPDYVNGEIEGFLLEYNTADFMEMGAILSSIFGVLGVEDNEYDYLLQILYSDDETRTHCIRLKSSGEEYPPAPSWTEFSKLLKKGASFRSRDDVKSVLIGICDENEEDECRIAALIRDDGYTLIVPIRFLEEKCLLETFEQFRLRPMFEKDDDCTEESVYLLDMPYNTEKELGEIVYEIIDEVFDGTLSEYAMELCVNGEENCAKYSWQGKFINGEGLGSDDYNSFCPSEIEDVTPDSGQIRQEKGYTKPLSENLSQSNNKKISEKWFNIASIIIFVIFVLVKIIKAIIS